MAPEQVTGDDTDARTDVYAVGCVFYQMLTGAVPYERENTIAKLFAHVHDPPPALPDDLAELYPTFGGVIEKAMAKKPGDRYLSAGDFARGAASRAERDAVHGSRDRRGDRRRQAAPARRGTGTDADKSGDPTTAADDRTQRPVPGYVRAGRCSQRGRGRGPRRADRGFGGERRVADRHSGRRADRGFGAERRGADRGSSRCGRRRRWRRTGRWAVTCVQVGRARSFRRSGRWGCRGYRDHLGWVIVFADNETICRRGETRADKSSQRYGERDGPTTRQRRHCHGRHERTAPSSTPDAHSTAVRETAPQHQRP